jgi:hypothetical protein
VEAEGIRPEQVLECLERSGYLLESQLVSALVKAGYFVEPNQVLKDPRTGKSREIDLVAEHYSERVGPSEDVCVKTHFVAEIINNRYPVVLMTERPLSPNEDFESWVKYACTPDPNSFELSFDIFGERTPPRSALFSQYCGLTRKKDNDALMASHPDDMYSSLLKVAEFTEAELASFRSIEWSKPERFWRIFFWHPLLVLGGQLLMIQEGENGEPKAVDVESAFLEFNWHEGEIRRSTLIEFITANAFQYRLDEIVQMDADWETRLAALRREANAADPLEVK